MAVTLVDNRITVSNAETLTGWTGVSALNSTRAEGANSVAEAYNIATGIIYFTPGTALNLTNDLLYIQSYTNALQNGWKEATLGNSSHMAYIFDGTNELALAQAGSDRDVFKHGKGQVQFQSFLIDFDYLSTKNTNGEVLTISGSVGAFNDASVSRVGSRFVTLSKALGGGDNCFVDIIRVDEVDASGNTTTSNSGLSIYGGASGGTEGNFSEIVLEDESIAAGKGHGGIREYTSGSYGCQISLKFGTTNALGNAFFLDSNITLTFEGRDINNDKYGLYVFGNTTNTNDFRLSNSVITSAGPGVTVDMSSTFINVLDLNTVSFSNLLNTVSFPTDTVTNTLSHTVNSCTFNNCGTVTPGTVDFDNNNILNSNATTNALSISNDISALNTTITGYEGTAGTGALLWNSTADPDGNIDGSEFTKGTAATHAIEFGTNTPTTIGLTNLTFSGYNTTSGLTTSNDAVLYFPDTGADVTWTVNASNITGIISYRKARTGDTVNIVNTVAVTFTGLPDNTEVRVFAANTITELAGVENASDGTVGNRSFTYSLSAGTLTDVRIVNKLFEVFELYDFTHPSTASSIPISLRFDRNYIQ